MRRHLVRLALLSLAAGLGALVVVACGGNDKPPLTPDTVEPTLDAPDSGTPGTPGTATPPATPKK